MVSPKDFLKNATDEQLGLLDKILGAGEKEQKLCKKINRIYDSIENGVHSPDGMSITLCEDEDDAHIISLKPKKKLKEVKEQMKKYFKKAVELGMGDLEIIQKGYKHYVGKPLPKNL